MDQVGMINAVGIPSSSGNGNMSVMIGMVMSPIVVIFSVAGLVLFEWLEVAGLHRLIAATLLTKC